MKIQNIETGEVFKIYGTKEINRCLDIAQFLIFKDGRWTWIYSQDYKPYEE